MSCLVIINGGLGKNVMALNWMPALEEVYGDVYVVSPYVEVYKASPHVKRCCPPGSGFLKELIEDENCTILMHDPYDEPDFIRRKIHLFEAMRRAWNLPVSAKPQFQVELDSIPFLLDGFIANCPSDLGDYFLVQFTGGQSELGPNGHYNPASENIKRNYPFVSQLVDELRRRYPGYRIISYSLPSEPVPSVVERYPLAFWHYRILGARAKAIICIDSSLNHITYQLNTPKIVLWGETGPDQFGYTTEVENVINLREYTGYVPPHFRPLGPTVSEVPFTKPEAVLKALEILHV